MRQLRMCLVGYGGIGRVHSYGYHNLHLHHKLSPVQLVGVVSRSDKNRAEACRDFAFAWAETDFRTAVSRTDIDAVDCCTPNRLHAEVVEAAVTNGKAVYCEKPLTRTLDEAVQLARLVEEAGVPNQVAFNYRFLPAAITAHQLVRAGRLGKIVQFRAAYYHTGYWDPNRPFSWRMQKQHSGGGALYDLGSHIIDLVRFITNHDYSEVSSALHTEIKTRKLPGGTEAPVDVDDLAVLSVKTAQGAFGSIEASRLATGTEDDLTVEVYGELGSIRLSLMDPNYLQFFDAEQEPLGTAKAQGFAHLATGSRYPAPAQFPPGRSPVGWLQTHIASQADFVGRCAGKPAFGATFADGLHVQKLLHCAQLANDEKRWIQLT